MLSCINNGEDCIKLWSKSVPFRTTGTSELLSPLTSWQVQFREVYHFGLSILFFLPSRSLNSWLLFILVVEFLEALQRVKKSRPLVAKHERKDEFRTVNALPKCLQTHSGGQETVPFPCIQPGDMLCCAIALYLTAVSQQESRDLTPEMPPDYCCRAWGCSCRANFCHPSPGAEFLRTLSAAYQPHFRGDELLLIALFKWAKHTRRSLVKFWLRLRQVVLIHHHVSVISY